MRNGSSDKVRAALRAHDEALRALGLDLWLGGEPTFTRRASFDPEWNGGALGDDKLARGSRVMARLAAALPGCAVLRTTGRLYPGEDTPRWSVGVYGRRDGAAMWSGPPDPALGGARGSSDEARQLAAAVELVAECRDGFVHVELPELESVDAFRQCLERIAAAAREIGLQGVVLCGKPPPVDSSVAWTTVTPDPGVLEINMAPARTAGEFFEVVCGLHDAAVAEGLSPRRWLFNGDEMESGGGSHLTFGGASPRESPFFKHPLLLPRLVSYASWHPVLSYGFAPDGLGGSSQYPRLDEGAVDLFAEVKLALHTLSHLKEVTPEVLGGTLGPLLADRTGNTHRSEINIEKLWNPGMPRRGCMGVVELRAQRMQPTPERAAAVAALYRAVVARLATRPLELLLADWGEALQDRFALPTFLERDLHAVFDDLDAAGLGLGAALREPLLTALDCPLGTVELEPGITAVIRRANEFWPVVGDQTDPSYTSRTIDASCGRVEVAVHGDTSDAWRLLVLGHEVPLRRDGRVRLRGVRYRRFMPMPGLHPTVASSDPLELALFRDDRAWRLQLFGWHPRGEAYAGLPEDAAEAAARRSERVVATACDAPEQPAKPPDAALGEYTFDARYVVEPPR